MERSKNGRARIEAELRIVKKQNELLAAKVILLEEKYKRASPRNYRNISLNRKHRHKIRDFLGKYDGKGLFKNQ